MNKQPAIYILTNKPNGVLYIGVTSNLQQRIYQHKNKLIKGFTSRYNCQQLVYYEIFDDMLTAITPEKQLKAGSRQKKCNLIISLNPDWKDLTNDILG